MEFRKIADIAEYVRNGLEDGSLTQCTYRKRGEFRAVQGAEGEKVVTVTANGLVETENTVTADENGNPGWIVTGSGGEKYIVTDAVFRQKYQPVNGREGVYSAVGKPVKAAQLDENICFIAPWGEEMRILAGGYIIFTDPSDIYGIQQAEFEATYGKM